MKSTLHSLTFGLALSLAGSVSVFAQPTITYTDLETKSGALDTTAPNDPTTLDLAAGTATQSGNITGTGSLATAGGGVIILTGNNTYTGSTAIGGSTLRLGSNTALPATTFVNISSGGLDLNGYSATVQTINVFNPGSTISLGSVTPSTLTIDGNGSALILGGITGTGHIDVTKGAGLLLYGTNSYSGGTTIAVGSVYFDTKSSMPSSGTLTVAAGATASFGLGTGGNFSQGDIATILANHSFQAGAKLGLDTSAGDYSYTNVIANTAAGALGLIKEGSNKLALSAANTYSGGTLVTSGTLALGASGSIANTPSITLRNSSIFDVSAVSGGFTLGSGKTIAGAGSIAGSFTLGAGAHLSPGESGFNGTLAFKDLTLANGSFLNFDLGTTSDFLQIANLGTFNASDGTHTFLFSAASGFHAGSYTLINWTNATVDAFTEANFLASGPGGAGNYSFSIVGSNLVVTVAAIPEPSAWAALLSLGALGLAVWRRRAPAAS